MRVITIASDIDHPLLNGGLVPSCQAVGLDLTVLHAERSNFEPGDKRAILTDYLSRHATSDEVIVFTDAYDALFIQGEGFIRDRYARFPQSIVFSAETNSWPLGPLGLALQEAPPVAPYPYLNSGGFIGPVGHIIDLLTKYPDPPSGQFDLLRRLKVHNFDADSRCSFSDQYYWTLVQLLEPGAIGIDNKAILFECFAPSLDLWDVDKLKTEFCMRGREADGYRRERARLVERLQTPSSAAQLHFASPMTKAVAVDLLEAGELPAWLSRFVGPQRTSHATVQVQRV